MTRDMRVAAAAVVVVVVGVLVGCGGGSKSACDRAQVGKTTASDVLRANLMASTTRTVDPTGRRVTDVSTEDGSTLYFAMSGSQLLVAKECR
jgi:hypothetical protein